VSRPLQIVLSLFVWWILVVAPGVLTVAGVFGKVAEETDLGGWVFGAWIVFYLAQLAWLMVVVTKAVGHARTGWMFISSLLPWAVSWAPAYGWGWGLLWIGFAGAVTTGMIVLALRSLTLETMGRRAIGTVVKVLPNRMNVVINNVYIRRRVLLEIPGADGQPYQAVLPMLCEIGTSPKKGDTFRLRVDPKNPKHLALEPSSRDED
jgi:hypothetical protein